jgi:molybdenum cofactor cytidylyltransferase
MLKVGLILLAAGQAKRMGSPKQLLEFNGVPMLRLAAESALASLCHPIMIVTGANAKAVSKVIANLPVNIIYNRDWEQGIGTSIRIGINSLLDYNVDAAVIALADQPLLSTPTFDRLVESYQHHQLPIVASEYNETLGVPALFERSLFPRLLSLPPDKGCKNLIMTYPPKQVDHCPCSEAGIDIDTPDDYAHLVSEHAQA